MTFQGGNEDRTVVLTEREAKVLWAVMLGLDNQQIATAFILQKSTAARYVYRMMRLLNFKRGELARWGYQHPAALHRKPCDLTLHPIGCRCGETCRIAAEFDAAAGLTPDLGTTWRLRRGLHPHIVF